MPLEWAACYGHGGVVKLLLGRENIEPDKPNEIGHAPLWCAAINGNEGVVKYYSNGTMSIPTNQITIAKRHSSGLLTMGTREW